MTVDGTRGRSRAYLAGLAASLIVVPLLRNHAVGFQSVAATAPAESARMVVHRQLERRFEQAMQGGPKSALDFAEAELQRVKRQGSDEQTQGDALEILAQAQLANLMSQQHPAHKDWEQGLELASEVVKIRRRAHVTTPADNELLAMALGLNGTYLFAVDRYAESDAMLEESFKVYASAYKPGDVRLAEKLELQAEFVEKGFGRPDRVIELLSQAVSIREQDPSSSGPKLAETLVELAMTEMNTGAIADADGHLSKATDLLRERLRRAHDDEEAKALLVQGLVLRSGIAARLANPTDAARFAREAQAIKFNDRLTQVQMTLIAAEAATTQYALTGQTDAAIAEEKEELQVIRDNIGLFQEHPDEHGLDIGMLGDSEQSLGELYLKTGDLTSAAASLAAAQKQLGNTSGILFDLAELAARRGDTQSAAVNYRSALRSRKENAAEATVLFGTNRAPTAQPPLKLPARADFSDRLSESLWLGIANVLVPGGPYADPTPPGKTFTERLGNTHSKEQVLPVGAATVASQLVVASQTILSEAAFRAKAATLTKSAKLNPGAVLVFVHGFNVTFEEALKRAAQLHRDLNFDGPVAVYSWPSLGKVLRYGTDRLTADSSVQGLCDFLNEIVSATGATTVHVIAHSMGNRVLLPALRKLARSQDSAVTGRLGEIVLAAPAVPEHDFDVWVGDIVDHSINHVTLYASHVDRALMAGWWREWGTTLAGYSTKNAPLTHVGMQSIDITKAASGDLTDLNHDVFASNPVISEDIRQLFRHGARQTPDRRLPGLLYKKCPGGSLPYWYYDPPAARSMEGVSQRESGCASEAGPSAPH